MGSFGLGKTQSAASGFPGVEESICVRSSIWVASETGIATGFALAVCSLHFLFNGQYGYFRDELYYVACGQHLAWGYVDQAPLIALIAKVSRGLLGDSLRALRFFPALSSGVKVLITAW